MDDTIKRVSCMECNKTFGRNSDLNRHVRRFHYEKWLELAPQTQRSFAFSCTHCNKNFSYRKNLNFHLKTHGIKVNDRKKRKCPMCDYRTTFRTDFYLHLQNVHEIQVETEELYLKPDEFMNWKHKFQAKTKSKFVVERVTKKSVQYTCRHSGYFKSTAKGKRRIKIRRPYKIDGFCPAGIKTVENNGELTVSIVKTHIGHQNDLGHLSLTQAREGVASKIAHKTPLEVILIEIIDDDSETSETMEDRLCTNKTGNGELINHLDAQNIESEGTFDDIQKSTFEACTLTLKERKCMMEKHFNAILNSADTEEELETIKSLMKPMQPTLDAMKTSTSSTHYKYTRKKPNK